MMCGRYHFGPVTQRYWQELRAFVDALPGGWQPRYNIAPTTPAVVLLQDEWGERRLERFRWGLLPPWAKDSRFGARTFNARAESVQERAAFREAFAKRRCLVLATGYYEWQKRGPKQKQAYNLRLKDGRPMLFHGLWEVWWGPPGERLAEPLKSFTVLTIKANELTAAIHDRMPCLTTWDDAGIDRWLNPQFQASGPLQSMLRPFASREMDAVAVSNFVNKATNEGPQCLEPLF